MSLTLYITLIYAMGTWDTPFNTPGDALSTNSEPCLLNVLRFGHTIFAYSAVQNICLTQ